jgi:hypothetical protein
LYFARHTAPGYSEIDWRAFLRMPGNGWIALDLTLIGLFAGFFIVPLFALVQSRTPRGELSRVIAGNNIINAVFLVAAAVFAFGMLATGLTIPQLFLVTALLNAAVTAWIFMLVPEFLMRFVGWLLISVLYRVRATGLEKIPDEGPALLVCNHVSFMDALIIMGSVRRPVRFVMYYKIFRVPVLSFVFRAAKAIPIAGGKENPKLMVRIRCRRRGAGRGRTRLHLPRRGLDAGRRNRAVPGRRREGARAPPGAGGPAGAARLVAQHVEPARFETRARAIAAALSCAHRTRGRSAHGWCFQHRTGDGGNGARAARCRGVTAASQGA